MEGEEEEEEEEGEEEEEEEEGEEEEEDEEGDGDENANKDEENAGSAGPDTLSSPDSVLEATSEAPQANPTQQLPTIDLSSLGLDSQLDLGNLAPRTAAPEPTGAY